MAAIKSKGANPGKDVKKKKKKMSAKKAKKKEDEEAANQQRSQELKGLRTSYANSCKKFITDPLPPLAKRLDKSVQTFEDLDKIIVSNCAVTLSDIYAIYTTFTAYNPLTSLSFWRTKIDAKSLEMLSKMVLQHPTLKTLQLVDCGLGRAEAEYVAKICAGGKILESVMLDHNAIGSSGAMLIFEAMTGSSGGTPSQISSFSLRFCDIGPKAADSIALALNTSTTLAELDLSYNRLGDDGVIPVAKSLAENKSLKVLNLTANQITDREKGLSTNPGTITGVLKVLDINTQQVIKAPVTTDITAVGLLCASLATENNGLTELDLRGNHIGQRGGEFVLEMLKARKQLASAKRAEPLKVRVSERMSGDLFEEIMDLNDIMDDLMKKGAKKGGGKKGGKKKK
ncbi:NACHT, LRR and PYD domains-containing protein 5 [Phlyctochytrium planicorne]|nr:NACHT, LRR and PYD domains-containing protein 5 [Phlyctochytrium planicorne]